MPLTLKELATEAGVKQLITATGGTGSFYSDPKRALGVMLVAQRAVQNYPTLQHLKIRIKPNMKNAFYNYEKSEIVLGLVEPIGLAHEIEHANNVKQDSLYSKVLKAAQGISRLSNAAALPTVLALQTFIQDPARRDDILKTLSAVSAAAAAPGLAEEAHASASTMVNNPNRLEAMKTLGPAFLKHLVYSMSPVVTYKMGRLS